MDINGAQGMKEMHDCGASSIIQDEKTSVVWGIPGEAYKLGYADPMVPISRVANKIIELALNNVMDEFY